MEKLTKEEIEMCLAAIGILVGENEVKEPKKWDDLFDKLIRIKDEVQA